MAGAAGVPAPVAALDDASCKPSPSAAPADETPRHHATRRATQLATLSPADGRPPPSTLPAASSGRVVQPTCASIHPLSPPDAETAFADAVGAFPCTPLDGGLLQAALCEVAAEVDDATREKALLHRDACLGSVAAIEGQLAALKQRLGTIDDERAGGVLGMDAQLSRLSQTLASLQASIHQELRILTSTLAGFGDCVAGLDAEFYDGPFADAAHGSPDNQGAKPEYFEYDMAQADTASGRTIVVRPCGTAQWRLFPETADDGRLNGESVFRRDAACQRLAPYDGPVGRRCKFILRMYPSLNKLKWSQCRAADGSTMPRSIKGVIALCAYMRGDAKPSRGGGGRTSSEGTQDQAAADDDTKRSVEDAGADSPPSTGAKRQRSAAEAQPPPPKLVKCEPELDATTRRRLELIPLYSLLEVRPSARKYQLMDEGVMHLAVDGEPVCPSIAAWAEARLRDCPGIRWERDLLVDGVDFGDTAAYGERGEGVPCAAIQID